MLAAAGGCSKDGARSGAIDLAPQGELGPTVGSFAQMTRPEPVAVEGYGLVGGLAGTGSAYCPPQVRAYLKQYILAQLPDGRGNVEELINGRDTAVVWLEGEVPPPPSKDEHFDVRVGLLPGSEATSLQGLLGVTQMTAEQFKAIAAGEELWRGTITAGKLADLVVLSRDIFAGEAMEILTTQVEMTLLDGRIVHAL